jgi:hypothetical protein
MVASNISQYVVFHTSATAVLHKRFAGQKQSGIGSFKHAQINAIKQLIRRLDGGLAIRF